MNNFCGELQNAANFLGSPDQDESGHGMSCVQAECIVSLQLLAQNPPPPNPLLKKVS